MPDVSNAVHSNGEPPFDHGISIKFSCNDGFVSEIPGVFEFSWLCQDGEWHPEAMNGPSNCSGEIFQAHHHGWFNK